MNRKYNPAKDSTPFVRLLPIPGSVLFVHLPPCGCSIPRHACIPSPGSTRQAIGIQLNPLIHVNKTQNYNLWQFPFHSGSSHTWIRGGVEVTKYPIQIGNSFSTLGLQQNAKGPSIFSANNETSMHGFCPELHKGWLFAVTCQCSDIDNNPLKLRVQNHSSFVRENHMQILGNVQLKVID